MEAQSYYRILHQQDNNFQDNSHYLIVNCAGCCVLPQKFYSSRPHGRSDYYMLYLCRGSLLLSSGSHKEEADLHLHAGQLFVFPPHTGYHYENEDSEEINYLWVHFTGYGAAVLLSDCGLPIGAVRTVGFPQEADACYRALFRTFLLRGPCFDTAAAACLMNICAVFGRSLPQQETVPSNQSSPDTCADRIYTSLSYLHENLKKPLSISALAAMEHLGVSRYRSLFHEVTGLSPSAYITGLRLSRAQELLTQTDLPLSEIAAVIGYSDPLYFSRVFRRHLEESPGMYRKHRKEK